jgi:hypothetical protein
MLKELTSFLRDLALAIIRPILLLVAGAGLFVLGTVQGWDWLMFGGAVVFLVGGMFIWRGWLGMD